MNPDVPLCIAGQPWCGQDLREIRDPWNQELVARVAWAGPQQLETALQGAQRAAPEMRRAARAERSQWCQSIARGLEQDLEGFAWSITRESGKPIRLARDEVRRAITTFSLAAHEALRFGGEVIPLDITPASAGYLGQTRRVGSGPVAAITPFNFPLNLVAHKVAPALAVGNPVILKPAPATPLTSLRLAQLVVESGVPAGGISCLNLEIPEIEALVDDPRAPIVSFTGSATVGWDLKARAAHKRVVLELGGNASALIHGDANLEHAISRLAVGGYAYAGQVCISVQHILVQDTHYQQFVEGYCREVAGLVCGDPHQEATLVGPLIRSRELTRLEEWVAEAVEAGAQLLLGGRAEPPCFQPTILAQVPDHCRVGCEEVFGPITTVAPYSTWEEALSRVNSSPYGLQVGVFTRDMERILSAWDELEVGAVIANDFPTFRVDNMPYGGIKRSGVGREGVAYTMEEMSEPRLLVLNRNPLR